jgi:hypothetical protein
MGPAGRCIPGNLTSADADGRVTFAPGARLMAPPPGLTVCIDFQRSRATWAFYTDTFGSDEDGHWKATRRGSRALASGVWTTKAAAGGTA